MKAIRTILTALVIASLLTAGRIQQVKAIDFGAVYVNINATGSNNGASWKDAYTDLQTALANTLSGSIWVARGTYYPTSGTDRLATFTLKNGVKIYGGFVGTETLLTQRNWTTNVTTLSGDIGTVGVATDNSYHVVKGSGTDNTAVLDGFTITAGNANFSGTGASGGGIFNSYGSPTISNVTFSGNSASHGGGMYNADSSPSLTNVTFSSNTGGGMYNFDFSNPSLTGVTFSGNSADKGGGMFNF